MRSERLKNLDAETYRGSDGDESGDRALPMPSSFPKIPFFSAFGPEYVDFVSVVRPSFSRYLPIAPELSEFTPNIEERKKFNLSRGNFHK